MAIRRMRILSWITTLVMVFSILEGATLFPSSAAVESKVWDGTADTSWYNAEETSFTLTTAEELAGLSSLVNSDTDTFEGKTIRLGKDIYLNEDHDTARMWTPIGQYVSIGGAGSAGTDTVTVSHYFKGCFDGQGHYVRNMYVDHASAVDECCERNGLFAMNYGIIMNLGVTGAVKSYRCGAGIAGYNEGSVKYCYSGCEISANGGGGQRGSGGIAGQNIGSVEFCWSDSSVYNAYRCAGGVVGNNACETDSETGEPTGRAGFINSCWFTGSVRSAGNTSKGSITAANDILNGAEIYNCYFLKGSSENNQGVGSYNTAEDQTGTFEFRTDGMLTQDSSKSILSELSAFSTAVAAGERSVTGSEAYPMLYWQAEGYEYSAPEDVTITVLQPSEGGKLKNIRTGKAAWGSDITLEYELEEGYKFLGYTVNGSSYGNPRLNVTEDVTVSAVFQPLTGAVITLEDTDACTVTAVDSSGNPVHSGEQVAENSVLTLNLSMKKDAVPEDEDMEYTGRAVFYEEETELNAEAAAQTEYTMTDHDVTITAVPEKARKEWISIADSSWYDASKDTFVLNTPQQLAGIAKLIRESETDFEGKTIRLGADLDLSNPDGTSGRRCWTAAGAPVYGSTGFSYAPVQIDSLESLERARVKYGAVYRKVEGSSYTPVTAYDPSFSYYKRMAFMGTFDGDGHRISNLYYNADDNASWYGGLFGTTLRAEIRNTAVSGSVSGSQKRSSAFAGGLVACALNGTIIKGCSSEINIELTDGMDSCCTGGILGGSSVSNPAADPGAAVTVSDCVNYTDISTAGPNTGGIAGRISQASLSDCMNFGNITARSKAGGIAGSTFSMSNTALKIQRCGNEGSVSAVTETPGKSSTEASAGGILGYAAMDASIDECFNRGVVDGGNGHGAGGITGNIQAYEVSVVNSYNTGDITSGFTGNSNTVNNNGIGGLTGYNRSKAEIGENCYNAGAITATASTAGSQDVRIDQGGIAGFNYSPAGIKLKGFYLDSSCGQGCGYSRSGDLSEIRAETAESMRSDAFVRALGGSYRAAETINDRYPILQWEKDKVRHTVSMAAAENGRASVSAPSAVAGDSVRVSASPSIGYLTDTVSYYTVDPSDRTEIKAVDGVFSFRMPDADVTVTVTFKEDPSVVAAVYGVELTMAGLLAHPSVITATDASGFSSVCEGITMADLARYYGAEIPAGSKMVTVSGKDGSGDYIKEISREEISGAMLAWSVDTDSTKADSKVRLVIDGTARGLWVSSVYEIEGIVDTSWDGITVSESLPGKGTDDAPFEIGSGADLAYMQAQVNAGDGKIRPADGGEAADAAAASYILTADIDLNGKRWTPIGGGTEKIDLDISSQEALDAALAEYRLIYDHTGNSYVAGSDKNVAYNESYSYYYLKGSDFAGVFDGDGHSIKGLNVDTDQGFAGLFGQVGGTLKDFELSGTVRSGGNGKDYVGAVTGLLASGGRISGVTTSVDVTAEAMYNVGGIAGFTGSKLSADSAGNTLVENCKNTGRITGYSQVGGITGENAGVIRCCANTGDIDGKKTGSKNGTAGIAGRNGNNNNAVEIGVIESCYNTGTIGNAELKWTGGIAGFQSTGCSIRNCYNTGTVLGTAQFNPIIGQSEGDVDRCFSLDSTITVDEDGVYRANGTKTNCAAKTREEMFDDSFVELLNGGNGDGFQSSCGYPVLSWEEPLSHSFDKDHTCSICGKKETCPSEKFTDLIAGRWYHDAVDYVLNQNFFKGTGDTTFEPDGSMTRAMFVTVLSRMDGISASEYTGSDFSDVETGKWFSEAICWASRKEIVKGVGDGKFNPDAKVTREQMAVILYNYAKYKGVDVSGADASRFASFTDKDSVSAWAADAMSWATSVGVINGMGENRLAPRESSTRAQVAQIIKNYTDKVA